MMKLVLFLVSFAFVASTWAESNPGDKINVVMESGEKWSWLGKPSTIKCYYWLDSGEDLPVTITWTVGEGGPHADDVLATCHRFTKQSGKCQTLDVKDKRFEIASKDMMVALIIKNIRAGDDRNHWCSVELSGDDADDAELSHDHASTVLRIYNEGQQLPKFHTVQVDKSPSSAQAGGQIELECTCDGYHCDELMWYKGPDNSGQYELVFTKTMANGGHTEIEEKGHGRWKGRTSLKDGLTLMMSEVVADDSGRYWCEVRASDMYQIGEYAVDASSTVLHLN